jgi:tetratricopeptide (TPR) repeat protein
MNSAPEPVGTIEVALDHAGRLLETEPALAAEQAHEILRAAPNHPLATLFVGIAQRRLGDATGALEILQPLAHAQPGWAPAHYELGVTLGILRRGDEAVRSLRQAVRLKPDIGDAWRLLGVAPTPPTRSRSRRDPRSATARCRRSALRWPRRRRRTSAAAASGCPSDRCRGDPHAGRGGRAARSLWRCREPVARALELAPGFDAARHNLATVLHRQNKAEAALVEVEALLAKSPHDAGCRNLKAAILTRIGEYPRAIEMFGDVLRQFPHNAPLWMSYGHALKTAGRQEEAVRAYRRCIELAPRLGEAWWSLANLKTVRFEPADLDVMRGQLARGDLSAEDRYHFEFSLGKALEDARDYAASFGHYSEGNRLRRELIHWSADDNHAHVERSHAVLTPALFARHAGSGCPRPTRSSWWACRAPARR